MLSEGQVVQQFSDQQREAACKVQWQAELLAGAHWPQRGEASRLSVPVDWTAWLLMDKAGVPLELIAAVSHAKPRHVVKRIRAAKALLIWSPYAAKVEKLMKKMPRFGSDHVPTLKSAKGARCAARVG